MSQHDHNSMTTPLYKAKGSGAAKEGTHHWWMQRVTSVALLPLSLFFLFNLKKLASPDYATMMLFLANPPVTIALISFIIITFYHTCMGLQVVVEDYVHCPCAKTALLMFNQIFFFILGVAAVYAALTIGFNFADYSVQLDNQG